jgi:hypothetical protein
VARTVIRKVVAWDAAAGASVALHPGALIEAYRICRNPVDGEWHDAAPYVMEFELAGQQLRCPLVEFQARTEAIPQVTLEQKPARVMAAVS